MRNEKLCEPTIPSVFVYDALQSTYFRGLNAEELLAHADIDSRLLNHPESRISIRDYENLIQCIITATQDGFLGFLDSNIPVRAFSVFASQLAGCRNLNEVLVQANRFFSLFTKQFEFDVALDPDKVRIALNFRETQAIDYRFIYQSFLIVVLRLVHWLTNDTRPPESVGFTFDARALSHHFSYLFGCPVAFEQNSNEIIFSREVFDIQISTNLDQIAQMLKDSTRMLLINHRPTPYTQGVRRAFLVDHPEQWPSIEIVCEGLKISKNLLWRKLRKEQTSFLAIRDEIKRDCALSLVQDTSIRISDIADRAGFSDTSAFNKAFQKWTGTTPSKYRASTSPN